MPKITEKILIEILSAKLKMPKTKVKRILKVIKLTIEEELVKRNSVTLKNFVTFHLVKYKDRIMTNLNNPKQRIRIYSTYFAKIKPSMRLRNKVR
jgi:nucleoid DNA-binding protein